MRRMPSPGTDGVAGETMRTCSSCHADVPEGMRFCLQCGAPIELGPARGARSSEFDGAMPSQPVNLPAEEPASPVAPAATPGPPPHRVMPTVPLKISPAPVLTPRAPGPTRSTLEDLISEWDEGSSRESVRKTDQPGAVVCRFCKWPLHLDEEYCEQCGAPVAEAAPPGALRTESDPAAIPAVPPAGAAPPSQPAAAAEPPTTPIPNHPAVAPPMPASFEEPTLAMPDEMPVPIPLPPPPAPVAEEQPSGFMGRLKRIFKKD
jgi:hypothetical protein